MSEYQSDNQMMNIVEEGSLKKEFEDKCKILSSKYNSKEVFENSKIDIKTIYDDGIKILLTHINSYYIHVFDINYLILQGIIKKDGEQFYLLMKDVLNYDEAKYFISMVSNIYKDEFPLNDIQSIIYFFDIADKFRLESSFIDTALSQLMDNSSILDWHLMGEICEHYRNREFGPHMERLFNILSKYVQVGDSLWIYTIPSKCFIFRRSREIIVEYFSKDTYNVLSEHGLLICLVNKILSILNKDYLEVPTVAVYELLKIVRYLHVSRKQFAEEMKRLEEQYGEIYVDESIEKMFSLREKLVKDSVDETEEGYPFEENDKYSRLNNKYFVRYDTRKNHVFIVTTTTLEPYTVTFVIQGNNEINLECLVPQNKKVRAKFTILTSNTADAKVSTGMNDFDLQFTENNNIQSIGRVTISKRFFFLVFKNLWLEDS